MKNLILLSFICILLFSCCKDSSDTFDNNTRVVKPVTPSYIIGEKFSYSIDSTYYYDEMGVNITAPVRGGTYQFLSASNYKLNEWKLFKNHIYNYVEKGTFSIKDNSITFNVDSQKGDSIITYRQKKYNAYFNSDNSLVYNSQTYINR